MADDFVNYLTKALDSLPNRLNLAVERTFWSVLEKKSFEFRMHLQANTPVRKWNLVRSIKIKKIDKTSKRTGKRKIGYMVYFDGYSVDSKGKRRSPYQVIANSLNHGWLQTVYSSKKKELITYHHPTVITHNGDNLVENRDYYQFIKQCLRVLRGIDEELNRECNEAVNRISL